MKEKNKFILSQNSNKIKNFKGIENKFNFNIKDNSKNKFKLNLSGLTNFEVYKKRKLKSNEKQDQYSSNNSIDVLSTRSKKFSNYKINNNNNSIHNTSIKSCNYVSKDDKNNLDFYRNDKSLVLSGKIQKIIKLHFLIMLQNYLLKIGQPILITLII